MRSIWVANCSFLLPHAVVAVVAHVLRVVLLVFVRTVEDQLVLATLKFTFQIDFEVSAFFLNLVGS